MERMVPMNRVVITGMGAITPIGNTVSQMWENMKAGVCGIGMISKFDTTDCKVKVAAEVKDFDPLQYMEKGDVRKFDTFCHYAMAAAVQAVEESGICGTLPPERIGTYFGSGIGGIGTFAEEQKTLIEKGSRRVSPFFIPSLIINMAGGLIAIKYNFQGASLPSVTACATGNNAIGEAYRAIKHGYLDAVLAGGSEAAIIPIGVAGFSNMKALSTTEDPAAACVPFDARRNGFVMGEGAGALMLEEYEHAKARGAKIYGEICGYGVTCDAHHITAPHPEALGGSRALRMAYEEAGGCADASHIYVNAHGTSTPLNDSSETIAIKKGLGEDAAYKCMVSSTKSMTGHMLGAAGAVEAIASILAVKENIVPPTIGYQEKDPACDLDYVPNTAREAQVDLALSASLGFGGHNAYLAFRKAD
jgi:3-oxoacyl-[acyl-carrier-protein] synthase II